jgi:hypothetical protein
MFPSIRIEGAILSADILDKIEREDLPGQRPADFGLAPATKVKDEVAAAWADAKAQWSIFRRRTTSPPSSFIIHNSSFTTETRNLWLVPLLGILGYRPELARSGEVVNGKNYPVSHRLPDRDALPLHLIGFNDSLDTKVRRSADPTPSSLLIPNSSFKTSPHGLLQEYLNVTEHLYGLVANGRVLRLLRNSSRLIRLSFLEFDLERMMEEDLFADFALLYRLLHVTRLPRTRAEAPASWIEHYHQDSLEQGSRIRDGLSKAVEEVILTLGNGFLKENLRRKKEEGGAASGEWRVANGDESANEDLPTSSFIIHNSSFFLSLLRLVYRLLFLFVIEERDLVFTPDADRRKRDIYYRHYSLQRLRRLAEKRGLAEDTHDDLWTALLATFRLFEPGDHGAPLGISPLAGDLFSPSAIEPLHTLRLPNTLLRDCLRKLGLFTHPRTGQRMRVNYAALNVEEFGSVYEGLLEYEPVITTEGDRPTFALVKGDDRANTGSHYTPDDLVQPLIKHSLDHLIAERLEQARQEAEAAPKHLHNSSLIIHHSEKALLSLRVADIACGSGHILLAAARRIGLALATVRTGEEQPAPAALRMAVRDVIRHCIYGVDLNPLAVELCKVALWLEAHVPGQPLNFLDHHIKCGNAIVGFVRRDELDKGVPDEAFKTLPGDDKDLAAEFRKRNKAERKEHATGQRKLTLAPALQKQLDDILRRWGDLSALPEHTPAQIAEKKRRFDEFSSGKDAWLLEQIAAIPIAQFYTPKTHGHKNHLLTDEPYRAFLSGQRHPQGEATAHAWATAHRKRFFHWFLQFPDILEQGGFDCILGNPPYLGGQALSGTYGYPFCEYVRWQYAPTGLSELVAFFLRRIHSLLRPGGFTAFITTNSIKDGDVRKDGLEQVVAQGAAINMAVRGIKWPGRANLVVSLVALHAGPWKGPYVLDNRTVETINPFFEDAENLGEPDKLPENDSRVFQGSIFLGDGFLLTHEAAERLRRNNPRNAEVLFPLINGQELNNQPDQVPGRTIINFFDWPEERAREFPEPFAIVEEKVKPFRATQNRKRNREVWWIYAEHRPGLLRNIAPLDRCFVAARTTKHLSFSASPTDRVFSDALYVFTTDRWDHFAVVQSTLHEVWARKYSGALKQDLRYSPSKCFDTFAFPAGLLANGEQRMASGGRQASSERRTASGESVSNHSPLTTHQSLETIGFAYHEHRRDLMLRLWLGLTDIYNLFHAPDLEERLEALFKKRMGNSEWRVAAKVPPEHMDTAGSLPLEDAIAGIERLRQLHVELDHTVLAAYGWGNEANSEQRVANRGGESHHSPFTTPHSPIKLDHDFHEIETLPENDRTRYTISPEARKEVLQRLLKLNHERAAEEAAAAKVVKPAKKRAKKSATKETGAKATEGGANVYFRRTVLAAEIIERLHRENTFGHVKFEKVIFLTERMLNLDFQSNYHRDAAGPYDNRALRSIDSQIKKLQWYAPVKSDKRYEYRPLAKAGAHKPYFDNWYGGKEDRFSEIIELLRPLSTQRCEIVATLYSAWEDFLAAGKTPTDAEIIAEVRNNWHPSKEAIEPERWQSALEWMRVKCLIPTKTTASTHEK